MPTKPEASGSPAKSPVCKTRKRAVSIDSDGEGASTGQFENATDKSPAAKSRKAVKRVRFSDLGPEVATTGLTPFIRRATLSPSTTRQLDKYPGISRQNRRSLPANLPSPTTFSDTTEIEEIQFTPLRQALNPRVRRRLRRSHLSEEINQFQADQREHTRVQAELSQLRSQMESREDTVKQLRSDLELQRLFSIEVNGEDEQRIQELELELSTWRAKAGTIKQEDITLDNNPDLPCDEIAYGDDNATEPDSPWQEETFFSSPTSRRFVEMSSPIPSEKDRTRSSTEHASCQASLPDPSRTEEIQAFEEAVSRLTRESSDAKSALETIKSELQALGFLPDATAENDIISSLREGFRAARLELEYLLPGETTGGTEQGSFLLKAMVAHVKTLVGRAKSDKKVIERQNQTESALRGQFNATVKKVADLEQRLVVIDSHRTNLIRDMEAKDEELEEARREIEAQVVEVRKSEKQVAHLEAEAEEQSTSINRLQAALVTYRNEVTSLETLVTKMEKANGEKDTHLAELRGQLELAIKENQDSSQTLSKLRQDVQESAFDLCALAKPELKDNVTHRRPHRKAQPIHLSTSTIETIAEETPHAKSLVSTEVSAGNKRDSGVAMVDDLETF